MAATDTDSVQDHMTRLRMKMVQQKIANEKDKLQRPDSVESNNDLESQVKLQQAMLRRQELLDKIRQEQMLNADFRRPRTYSARRRYTPSPLPAPPSRRSLPAEYFTHRGEETFRDRPDMSHVKHEIIHRVATPKPYHLPPLQNPPQAPAAPQTTFIPPPQVTMQAPAQPMIITAPQAPQHIIQQIPHPIFQNLVPNQSDNSRQMFGKADFMEMMMMQNAQMHQMVMQQMMLSSLPGSFPTTSRYLPVEAPRPAQSVHHHHYTTPAPVAAPPVVHHYTTMPAAPAADWGSSYPIRDRQPQPAPPSVYVPPARSVQGPPPRSVQGPPRDFSPVQRKSNLNTRPSSMFLFGIILKEIVAALHRIYLNPKGNIYPVLNDVIGPSAYDLSGLVRGGQLGTREESVLIQELQYVVENLVYHITEIMPSTGVLGTHKKSAVFELIRSGKRFPDGYFWEVELERLQFNENGRTMNIGDAEAFLLLIGIFISRSMVTTIMMKPVDYGLSNQALTEVAERNLRIVASTLLYLVRRVSASKGRDMMPMPTEIAKYLYSDDEMRNVYSRLSRTFNYAEGLLREWGTEYIRRLRQATYSSSRE